MAAPTCCSCEAGPGTVEVNGWAFCPSCALDYLDQAPEDDESDDFFGVPGGRGFDDARDRYEEESLDV